MHIPSVCVGFITGGVLYVAASREVAKKRERACEQLGMKEVAYKPIHPAYVTAVSGGSLGGLVIVIFSLGEIGWWYLLCFVWFGR